MTPPVDRSLRGLEDGQQRPWWAYPRRPLPNHPHGAPEGEPTEPTGASPTDGRGQDAPARPGDPPIDPASGDGEGNAGAGVQLFTQRLPSPRPLVVLGCLLLGITVLSSHLGQNSIGTFLVPAAGLLLAWAFSRRAARDRPDEPWLARWIVYGLAAKLVASFLRYQMLIIGYEGVGDASRYDRVGAEFARAWMTGATPPQLDDLQQTNFVSWFNGVVYFLFGHDMITGYFVFSLLAFVGSYLWYRATADAIPFLDRRLYLALVLFVPSIAFWPASIGKEALMQLGIGVMALGTSYLIRQRLFLGLLVALPGGWLLWVVRPHLLAMVALAGGIAYLVSTLRSKGATAGSLLTRPLGLIVISFLVIFTILQGAEFLGIENLSVNSVEAELNEQTARSDQGGSEFDTGDNSLNPLTLPKGAVTVLLRPFPWETDSGFQLLASLESALLTIFIVTRIGSLRVALARARASPFLLYGWVLVAAYAATFSSFANFGLLVRQRSLVLPALFLLLAVDPKRAGRSKLSEAEGDVAGTTRTQRSVPSGRSSSPLLQPPAPSRPSPH